MWGKAVALLPVLCPEAPPKHAPHAPSGGRERLLMSTQLDEIALERLQGGVAEAVFRPEPVEVQLRWERPRLAIGSVTFMGGIAKRGV